MVMRTVAIKNFLALRTHPDLAALYNHDMEVQVNVGQCGGQKVDGEYNGVKWLGWSDGITTWKPFRIPWNASTSPTYEDSEIRYDLDKYAEGIGLTGWDWKSKLSRWCAYDFDAITGHSERHQKKLSNEELKQLKDAVSLIPWVTVRSSTSGSGLHLYVFLQTPVPTSTHTEHAALARAILGLMSAMSGQDLQAKIDACGQNMWIWHKKMIGTSGLTVLKSGIPLDKVPPNWRDHLDVVSGKRKKVAPSFIKDAVGGEDEFERIFEELTGQRSKVSLDKEHLKLIKYLDDLDYVCWWDNDAHMLVTHTFALKKAHTELEFRGTYETISDGKDVTQNCFCYPLRNGAWVVRRYTRGVSEAKTWDQDKNGLTRCYFNRDPDLITLAKMNDAIEHKSGGYVFNEAEVASKALESLGITLDIPAFAAARPLKVKENKDGKVVLEMKHEDSDSPQKMKGWLLERGKWNRVETIKNQAISENELTNHDDIVRHVVSETGEDCGWLMKTNGFWRAEPLKHVTLGLSGLGLDNTEITSVEGASVLNAWTLVNRPFEPEYIGNRQWNRESIQLRFVPSAEKDTLHYPTWTKVLNHCGAGLDRFLQDNAWTKANGITTGGEYLKCWVASVLQMPREPLPYLFLYSKEQNSGKSTFHEALSLLITRGGVVEADRALGDSTFNGEIAGAVICYTEETDLRKNKGAYNRIKSWVTSPYITIRKLYEQPYSIVNTTHWIQTSNDQNAVPIEFGDTRICMINVPPLDTDNLVAKRDLMLQLEKEAPDFLAAVLNLEIPPYNDRLRLPVIQTSDKVDAEHSSLSMLELFIEEKCFYHPGNMVLVSDFTMRFHEWLDPQLISEWTKVRVGKEIDRNKFPKGRNPKDCQFNIGNISFNKPKDEDLKSKKLILGGPSKDKLMLEG